MIVAAILILAGVVAIAIVVYGERGMRRQLREWQDEFKKEWGPRG